VHTQRIESRFTDNVTSTQGRELGGSAGLGFGWGKNSVRVVGQATKTDEYTTGADRSAIEGDWMAVSHDGPHDVWDVPVDYTIELVTDSLGADTAATLGNLWNGAQTAMDDARIASNDLGRQLTSWLPGRDPARRRPDLPTAPPVDARSPQILVVHRFAAPRALTRMPVASRGARIVPADEPFRPLLPGLDAVRGGLIVVDSLNPTAMRSLQQEVLAALTRRDGPLRRWLTRSPSARLPVEQVLGEAFLAGHASHWLTGTPMSSSLGLHPQGRPTTMDITVQIGNPKAPSWSHGTLVRLPISVKGAASGSADGQAWPRVGSLTYEFDRDTWDRVGVGGPRAESVNTFLKGTGFSVPELNRRRGRSTSARNNTELGNIGLHAQSGPIGLVGVDFLVTVTATVGRRTDTVSILVDNAAIAAMAPPVMRGLGIEHPLGEATDAGWHISPSAGTDRAPTASALADAVHRIPRYPDMPVVSGQVDTDGLLLVRGVPTDPTVVGGLLASELPDRVTAVALVVSGGSAAAHRLAEALDLPVLATDGAVAVGRDGRVTTDRPWRVVRSGAEDHVLGTTALDAASAEARGLLSGPVAPPAAPEGLGLDLPGAGESFGVPGEPFTANVMAPLEVSDWETFRANHAEAARLGVDGVSVDVWWGKVGVADGVFDWDYYDRLFAAVTDAGLKVVPILSFHECGSNVGDAVQVPIPGWVWPKYEAAQLGAVAVGPDGLKYLSEHGNLSSETVQGWADPLVVGEYVRFAREFADHYRDRYDDGEILEINVSLGPAGELRYPAYNAHDWRYGDPQDSTRATFTTDYPTRGALQAYSPLAVQSFRRWALDRYGGLAGVNRAWGSQLRSVEEIAPPDDAEHFFASGDYRFVQYGKDFVDWYNSSLVAHGRTVLTAALDALGDAFPGADYGFKVPGVHWTMGHPVWPNAAPVAAGLVQTSIPWDDGTGHGYQNVAALAAHVQGLTDRMVVLHFTCLEMANQNWFPQYSLAQDLVFWMAQLAERLGVTIKGENALVGGVRSDLGWD
ncbi:MAG: family 14 glycosylhydrolase, partial [Phycicoccus sp.]